VYWLRARCAATVKAMRQGRPNFGAYIGGLGSLLLAGWIGARVTGDPSIWIAIGAALAAIVGGVFIWRAETVRPADTAKERTELEAEREALAVEMAAFDAEPTRTIYVPDGSHTEYPQEKAVRRADKFAKRQAWVRAETERLNEV
jgi:hypothetical protein